MFDSFDDFVDFVRSTAPSLGIATVILAVLIGLSGFIMPRMFYPTARAQFEELRRSSTVVDPTENEDVMGQVVDENRKLAKRKTCLQIWWCAWQEVPDWAGCERIEIPKRAHGKENK